MDGIWIVLIVVAIVLIALAAMLIARRKRTERLQTTFGPEYDRAVAEKGGARRAEAELEARRRRRSALEIRPLTPAARDRYMGSWQQAQSRFVDSPSEAVREADALVQTVMRERGYPVNDFEQRVTDVSVDHPAVAQNYRAAHGISLANEHGEASTEDLRQAMVHYRSLFDELLGSPEHEKRLSPDESRVRDR